MPCIQFHALATGREEGGMSCRIHILIKEWKGVGGIGDP